MITERVYLLVQGDRFIDKRSFKLITFTEEEKQSPAVARSWQEFDNKISSVSSTRGEVISLIIGTLHTFLALKCCN